MSATGKEFVVLGHRTAEIAEIGRKDEWSHDSSLSGVDFVFGNRAKHGFEFTYEVLRGEGSGTESMFRIDGLERHGSETARDG